MVPLRLWGRPKKKGVSTETIPTREVGGVPSTHWSCLGHKGERPGRGDVGTSAPDQETGVRRSKERGGGPENGPNLKELLVLSRRNPWCGQLGPSLIPWYRRTPSSGSGVGASGTSGREFLRRNLPLCAETLGTGVRTRYTRIPGWRRCPSPRDHS